jgi:hypothetical protein
MAGTWLNQDGLYLKFGTTKVVPDIGGEFKTYGDLRTIELDLDLSTLGVAGTNTIISDQVFVPVGARIEQVELVTHIAVAGAGTLDVGVINTDRTTIPAAPGAGATAFVAAATQAALAVAGTKIILTTGVATAGTFVGKTVATTGYITARSNAVAMTGNVHIRIKYYTSVP